MRNVVLLRNPGGRVAKTVCAGILIAILSLVLLPVAFGETVISNSQDWRDVYSVMVYSNLNGDSGMFLTSQRHSSLILNSVPKNSEILAVSSRSRPYFIGYESFLEGRGHDTEELVSDDINIELARRLDTINKYVIIDDAYGYNAVSVAPYAAVSHSYVLFADEDNIDQVEDLLDERDPDEVLIYGIVDREVRDVLARFDPEIINFDGDRFKNNIAIVRKYQLIAPKKQVILTNGEFIEQEILSGVEPVLFLGAQNVPDEIGAYLQEGGFEVAVLIGNQYVGSATTIRRATGVSVFVKFAQSARDPTGPISPVEGLDLFYVPVVILNLEIFSVEYNQATGMLEITIKNNVPQATYFRGSYVVNTPDGTQTVGDEETLFIDGNSFITMTYEVDPWEGDAYVDAFVIYGESKFALERTIEGRYNISLVRVFDESELSIIDAYYDRPNKRFVIIIENTGKVDLYADVILSDIIIDGILQQIGTGGEPILVKAGKKVKVYIEADLTDEDIEANPEINIVARYGQRSTGLVKVERATFEMRIKKVDIVYYGLVTTIIILILLIIFTKKKKCRHCKHKNPRKRKTCEKCGERLD